MQNTLLLRVLRRDTPAKYCTLPQSKGRLLNACDIDATVKHHHKLIAAALSKSSIVTAVMFCYLAKRIVYKEYIAVDIGNDYGLWHINKTFEPFNFSLSYHIEVAKKLLFLKNFIFF